MKRLVLPLGLVAAAGLTACNQQAAEQPAAAAEPEAVALDTEMQRVSYGIAYSMGVRMNADPSVTIDQPAFKAGIADALAGRDGRMTGEEIQNEIAAFQQKMQAEADATQQQLAQSNMVRSQAFLTKNRMREEVSVTDSGLQYEVVTQGTGERPGPDDVVQVHYRGTLSDGTQFDSSYYRGQPVSFGVGQVIPGWTEALQLMPVGSKWNLYIPPELGYGEGGAPGGRIGPNAALVFEVELLAIPSQEAAAEAPEADAG
ncbi:MAG: FKBP-type peptidyl-prolyl cis-trans isomerase [Pseudomonadota bacterium]